MPRRKIDCVPDKEKIKQIKLENKNDSQLNSRNSAQMIHLNDCQELKSSPHRVIELDARQKIVLSCSSNVNKRILPTHGDIHSSNRNIIIKSSKSSSNRMIQIDSSIEKISSTSSFINCKPLISNTKSNISISNRKINMSNSLKSPSNQMIQLDINQEITLPCSLISNYKSSLLNTRSDIHLLNCEMNINSSKLSNHMIKLDKKITSSCSSFLNLKPSLFSRKNQIHSLNRNIITDSSKLPLNQMIQVDSNKKITIENFSNIGDQSSIVNVKSEVRFINKNKCSNLPILSSNRIIDLDAPQKILLPIKSSNMKYMPLLPSTNEQNTDDFSMNHNIVTNLMPSSNKIIQLDNYQEIELTKNEVLFTENQNMQQILRSKNHVSCPVMLENDFNREQNLISDRSSFFCDNETINIESNSTTNDIIPQIILDPILDSSQNNLSLSENTDVQNNFVTYPTIDIFDENSINEHYIGAMNILCEHCNARHFASERVSHKNNSFNDCCSHGEVKLEDLKSPPSVIKELFDGTNEKSSHFYKRIRAYNNSFSFASFNANLVKFNNRRPGPYCFKIQGQIYYQINTSLYPAANEYPSYGQLFFIDSNEAAHFRCERNSELDKNILKSIDDTLRKYNEFAKSYQMMHEELQLSKMINNGTEPELQLLFSLKPGMDKNRFNFQRTNEVAAIFTTTADGDIPESYVTIRVKGTKQLQRISTMDSNVEPWIYPLFYPYGTRGWHRDIKCIKNPNRNVTRLAYVKYRIAIRDDFNVFLMGRRLFQQWIVDNYVKIEKDRTEYVKNNQKKIRADSYQGLIDHLEKRANNQNSHIGKMVILPSSFKGSPRNMLQLYQDAMALVRKYGKPDLFITMTCNPNWREISENLIEGQTASDRPDIVARVFELKKNQLLDYILKKKLFGEIVAYVYVIEFQKRGLPHIHLLVTLKQNNKITTPNVVDKYICAEIPDPDTNPKLHNIVMKNMIHGPCGDWCLINGKCSKNYPKKIQNETTMDENGYSYYRRRNTGKIYTRLNTHNVDNTNVVPHSKFLLLSLNCHINVEIVSSIKSVKYLYKYVYKGHDAAAIKIVNSENDTSNNNVIEHDEIKNYIETRYVGPVEANWRILNKHLHDKSHSILRLPVHLPNQQNIIINDEFDDITIRANLNKDTMLTAYFTLNAHDLEANELTYPEIPTHYVFKNETNTWEKRKLHFNTLGRMYSINPTQIELFHLRLLLVNVKGAKSFVDLRTVNGQICDTFVATCLALGLIEDDDEWKRALHEAEIWMMPRQLRRLFVRILIYCQPLHPEELWEEFKGAMIEDYSRHLQIDKAYEKAYKQIDKMLSYEGSGLDMFPSMQQIIQTDEINDDINNENNISPQEHKFIGTRNYEQLSGEQRNVIDTVLKSVSTDSTCETSNCFYINGPGGTGKTFVYITLYHLLRSEGRKVCTMAYTGIAATLLPNGKTVHKTFGMPVPLFGDSSSSIKCQSKDGEYLKNTDVFIWDEAPMAPKYALDLVDRTLRDIMNNDLPFGGKIILLGGDFRQLLPIKIHSTRSEMINLSIKFSDLWKCFTKFSLIQNMRTLPEETEFAKYLLSIGDGTLNDNNDNLTIPEHCIAPKNADIVEDMYGDLIQKKDYQNLTNIAILSARNIDVENINKRVVELLDKSTERIYTGVDSVENCDNGDINDAILPEYLNTLNPSNFPPYELRLRKNCVIMLIRNLSIDEGLCNGTRLQIIELTNNLLKCKILTGDKAGEIVFINRITLYCEDVYPFTFKRRQFPIKLAFAMTINKAQGQTFEKIGIDLEKDVFNHGQLYVAFSRVRSWKSLKVYLGNQRTNNTVKNYVYKELYDPIND